MQIGAKWSTVQRHETVNFGAEDRFRYIIVDPFRSSSFSCCEMFAVILTASCRTYIGLQRASADACYTIVIFVVF